MDRDKMIDMALEKIMNELDEIEGGEAMAHDMDNCPDPLTCDQHDSGLGDSLEDKPSVKIEVHKMGMPTLDGKEEEEEGEGLSPSEAEELRKLLK